MVSDKVTLYLKKLHTLLRPVVEKLRKRKYTKIQIVFGFIGLYILYLLITGGNRTTYQTTTQPVDFQTQTQEDTALPTGFSYVQNNGKAGVAEIQIAYTYKHDGILLSQKIVSTKVTVQPMNKVIVSGTMLLDQFGNGLRSKAQSFYDGYKNGNYTGTSAYLAYVSGTTSLPYSDKTIKQAVTDTSFSIKEITIGQPSLHIPSVYDYSMNTVITADLPFQIRSSDFLHPESVSEFTKTAYFDANKHTWLFPPISPILSVSESISSKFDGTTQNNTATISGTFGISKLIYAVPLSNNWGSSDPNLSLEILFAGSFDNGKAIQNIQLTDVRDDLGNTYPTPPNATPSSDGNVVWTTVSLDPKKIAGAKKLSFDVTHVTDDPNNTYSFWGNSNATSADLSGFVVTDVMLH